MKNLEQLDKGFLNIAADVDDNYAYASLHKDTRIAIQVLAMHKLLHDVEQARELGASGHDPYLAFGENIENFSEFLRYNINNSVSIKIQDPHVPGTMTLDMGNTDTSSLDTHDQDVGNTGINNTSDHPQHHIEDSPIRIRRYFEFMDLSRDFFKQKIDTYSNKWLDYADSGRIFRNATPIDFTEPELYIRRITREIADPRLTERTAWMTVSTLREGKYSLALRYQPTNAFAESPHELHIALCEERITHEDELPCIRFGFTDERTATVYATQTPTIQGYGEGSIHKDLSNNRTRMKEAARRFYDIARQYPNEFSSIFGEIKEQPEQLNLKQVHLLLNQIRSNYGVSNYSKLLKNVKDRIDDTELKDTNPEAFRAFIDGFSELYGSRGDHDRIKTIRKIYRQRRANTRRLNPVFRGKRAPDVETFSPSTVLSLGTFSIIAHREGIRRLIIPTFFPLRQHQDETIDARIFRQTIDSALNVVHEIQGMRISEYPDLDGNLYIEMDEELSSNRPIFADIIKKIQTDS